MSQAKGSWTRMAVLAGVMVFSSGARRKPHRHRPHRRPASRLREVNRILENTAWGSYRTEF